MNVKEYLDRIGYGGDLSPTLSTLEALSWTHKQVVCYTNLDCFGGKRIELDLELFYKKIVIDKCGGICYEINGLFVWLLQQLGFKVTQARAANYLEELQGFTEADRHNIPIVDFGELGKYIVDPGHLIAGPMKVVHMTPHIEKYAVYRLRQFQDQDNWYYIERHKKTVIDAKGVVIAEGPTPCDILNGMGSIECQKEQSSHWRPLNAVCLEPVDLNYFTSGCNGHQDDMDGIMMTKLVLRLYTQIGNNMIRGTTCHIKHCVDPITDKVLVSKELTNDAEVEKIAKDAFGYEVKHRVKFFERL